MNTIFRGLALGLLVLAGTLSSARISRFQHIILVIQENRTPDNLFQGLCLPPFGSASACGPNANQFDIQSYGFDKFGNKVLLNPVPLGNGFEPNHSHLAFVAMCNPNSTTHYPCVKNTRLSTSGCPANCAFQYVDPNATPTIEPYLYLAQHFGWANRMFETNQGPSAPAHQFLFAGTSALTPEDDQQATFVSENFIGCTGPADTLYYLVSPATAPYETKLFNTPPGAVCATHETLVDLLAPNFNWRYYAVGNPASDVSNSIWNAPLWIQSICQPNSTFTQCLGPQFVNNVDLKPADVLTDLQNCKLANMVWLTPTGLDSDHPSGSTTPADGGPAWRREAPLPPTGALPGWRMWLMRLATVPARIRLMEFPYRTGKTRQSL